MTNIPMVIRAIIVNIAPALPFMIPIHFLAL